MMDMMEKTLIGPPWPWDAGGGLGWDIVLYPINFLKNERNMYHKSHPDAVHVRPLKSSVAKKVSSHETFLSLRLTPHGESA
jgi:hypothetical protein